MHHISASNKKAVFVKLDFAKAFDTVEWEFLFQVMEARGFLSRWIVWIKALLKIAQSRVLVNGGET